MFCYLWGEAGLAASRIEKRGVRFRADRSQGKKLTSCRILSILSERFLFFEWS